MSEFAAAMKIGTTALVLELIEKIKQEGVSEDRLKRAKTQVKAADAFNRQSAEAGGNRGSGTSSTSSSTSGRRVP